MLKLGKLCADAPMHIVASPLPSMVFTPPSVPPFPGDRNPSGEGSTNCLRFLLNLMNVQSSNIKIQSLGWYHLHDCAMAHQRYIFQGSPLMGEVKVDDGFGKLAFWKPNIKLDIGSEWAISLHSHFLNILLSLLIFNTTYEIAKKD